MTGEKVELTLYAIGIVVSVYAIAFFLLSIRASGKLKLHITSLQKKYSMYLKIILFVVWLTTGILILIDAQTLLDFVKGAFWLILALDIILLVVSGVDIREKGILYRGRLIPWERIETFGWERLDSTNRLKINIGKPLWGFPKEIAFDVPADKIEKTDLLLSQYLPGAVLL
ncbi:MAG: hypothetical protein H6659_06970 [Ardenticatenaceae bacterium]|nr:hypothetical protein [Ardenticatenaceae bacterium]